MRILSRALIGAGVLLLTWVVLVWQWHDPFTALYTTWKQHELAQSLDKEFATFQPTAGMRKLALAARRDAVASDAAHFRRRSRTSTTSASATTSASRCRTRRSSTG